MADPLQALLAGRRRARRRRFPPTSRYADVGVATYAPTPAPGEQPVPVAFLRRRLVPRPERFALLYEVRVRRGRPARPARRAPPRRRRAVVAARRRERRDRPAPS